MTWQIQQRVNFYLEEFRPPALPQDIRQLLLQLGLSIVLMLVAALALLGYSRWLQHEQQQISQFIQNLTRQLEDETARYLPLVIDNGLQQQLEQVRRQLSDSQKILLYLGREQLQQSQSFTLLIAQLGEQQVRGVWLQGFSVRGGGQQLQLRGFVDEPEKLSPYVVELLQRSAYAGKSFSQIDIQRSEQRWLSFVLDTEAPAAGLDTTEPIPRRNVTHRQQQISSGGRL